MAGGGGGGGTERGSSICRGKETLGRWGRGEGRGSVHWHYSTLPFCTLL